MDELKPLIPYQMPNGQLKMPAQNCWVIWENRNGTWIPVPSLKRPPG